MAIIKQKSRGLLIVVSGPSGAGKDTVVGKLIKRDDQNVWVSISMTSRPPRGNEENGKDYFFVTKKEFEENIKAGNLLEYATYNDNYYGTPKSKINEYLDRGIDVILIIEISLMLVFVLKKHTSLRKVQIIMKEFIGLHTILQKYILD